MFETLSDRLGKTLRDVRGVGRLTEDNIRDALRDVRRALLEADVALPVIKEFVDHVRTRALGVEVTKSLTPGQALVKIVHEELIAVLGATSAPLNLKTQPPAVILLAGLQGSGKTTTAAKLARWLRERENKQVMVVSTDVYRPAAMEQLERLAGEVSVDYFAPASDDPVTIASAARAAAEKRFRDVLLVDTAGRLHIDATLMDEVKRLEATLKPIETLFVVDCMAGQDAAKAAAAFGEALPLTGTVLTKADGDARGGAALSVAHITGRPIKFMGMGEKTAALEVFHPDRVASRILGMGDVLSLVEEAEQKVDRQQAEKLARKLKKGGFDLEDFREQLAQMLNMGGLSALLDKLPGAAGMPAGVRDQVNDKELRRQIAIINSMTPRERRRPAIINGSRRRRIAAGSGNEVQHVNRLLKQFTQMQKMMKKASRGGMAKMMKRMKGRMPPGMMP
jgi:signal recognition particle subunit SRP54